MLVMCTRRVLLHVGRLRCRGIRGRLCEESTFFVCFALSSRRVDVPGTRVLLMALYDTTCLSVLSRGFGSTMASTVFVSAWCVVSKESCLPCRQLEGCHGAGATRVGHYERVSNGIANPRDTLQSQVCFKRTKYRSYQREGSKN